jgi:LemA protein
MKKLLIILGVIVLIVFIFIRWANGVYDNAIVKQEEVNKRWGDVQAAYQRRADLVPNLVATVKGAAENEKEILIRVTEARAGIVKAKTPQEMEMYGKEINTAINLAFEAYPQIRSTENFATLQAQLEGTENRINKSREDYNASVSTYNSHVRGVFRKFAINMMGDIEEFPKRESFEAQAGAENAPKVDFSNKPDTSK